MTADYESRTKTWTIPPVAVRVVALALAVASTHPSSKETETPWYVKRARWFEQYLIEGDKP